MPIVAEAPMTAQPKAKPTSVADPIERAALAGRSPLESASDKPAPKALDQDDEPVDVGAIDTSGLKQAQAADAAAKAGKSYSAPEPDGDADPAPNGKPDAKPTVPSLPEPEEWRPKGEKAGKQWDELKSRHATETQTLKAEIERTKSELAAAKSNGDAADVKALKEELKQYRELVRDVAIEKDPAFKQRFEPREKTAIEAAKLAAGDKGAKLETLLKSPPSPWRDEQIEAIKEDLSDSSKRRVDSALLLLDQIDLEKQSEIAMQRATFEQRQIMTASQQKEQQAAQAREMATVFENTLKTWTDPKAGHPFFTEKEGDAEHNSGVAAAKALAKEIFSGNMSPEDLARAALWGASGDKILKGWQTAVARAEKAEKALAKIRGNQPGDGRNGSPETEEVTAGPSPGTPGYMKWLNGELKARQERDMASRRGSG